MRIEISSYINIGGKGAGELRADKVKHGAEGQLGDPSPSGRENGSSVLYRNEEGVLFKRR